MPPNISALVRDPYNDPIPGLIALLDAEEAETRQDAARFLTEFPSPRALPSLIRSLRDEDSSVRYNAVDALVAIGNHQVISDILTLAKDSDEEVRGNVAWALGQFCVHSPEITSTLCVLLKDESWIVRRFAASALADVGDESAIPTLKSALSDVQVVRVWIWLALSCHGEPFPYSPLFRILRDGNELAKQESVQVLCRIANAKNARRFQRIVVRHLAKTNISPGLQERLEECRDQITGIIGDN